MSISALEKAHAWSNLNIESHLTCPQAVSRLSVMREIPPPSGGATTISG
ncbi:Uncharacterised protein [Vibrio cholerae]|nr:Uncharacterised protein [Vibrio cholerae]